MTFGGATWPEGWSRGAAPSSFTVDVPGGSVPAVGWSMALPADCGAAGSATPPESIATAPANRMAAIQR